MGWKSYKCTSITLHDRPIKSYKPFTRWTRAIVYLCMLYTNVIHLPVYSRLNQKRFLRFTEKFVFPVFCQNEIYFLELTMIRTLLVTWCIFSFHAIAMTEQNTTIFFTKILEDTQSLFAALPLIDNKIWKGSLWWKKSCWIK